MRKLTLPFLLLSLALTACGGGDTDTTPQTGLTLSGDTFIEIGKSAAVTLKDSNGNPITSGVSYSSDQPNVVAVDSAGNLTVKHLTATDKPVTITATANGKNAALQVKTFGLEMSVGSYVSSYSPSATTYIATRYRSTGANVRYAPITITSPSGSTDNCTATGRNATEVACVHYLSVPPSAGIFTASMTSGSLKASASTSFSDLNARLPLVTNPSVKLNGRTATCSGILANGIGEVSCVLSSNYLTKDDLLGEYIFGSGQTGKSLPIDVIIMDELNGSLSSQLTAYTTDPYDFSQIMDGQVNVSYVSANNVNVPPVYQGLAFLAGKIKLMNRNYVISAWNWGRQSVTQHDGTALGDISSDGLFVFRPSKDRLNKMQWFDLFNSGKSNCMMTGGPDSSLIFAALPDQKVNGNSAILLGRIDLDMMTAIGSAAVPFWSSAASSFSFSSTCTSAQNIKETTSGSVNLKPGWNVLVATQSRNSAGGRDAVLRDATPADPIQWVEFLR